MSPKKRPKKDPSQQELIDKTAQLKTAPCVPAIKEAVKAWRAGNYKGMTDTTRRLFDFWFHTDHRPKPNGITRYYDFQRESAGGKNV